MRSSSGCGMCSDVRRGDEHHVRQVVVDLQVVVGEGRVLLRVQHLEQRRGRIAAPVGAQLVDLVEQEERVGRLRLLHRLDDLAGHRADIGPPVAADLGLVAHAAERHAHELAARGLGDRLAERGLADAGRADQAEDRALQLRRARLHRQVLEDPLLDLLQAVVVVVEHLLGLDDVVLDLAALPPRDATASSRGSCAPPSPRPTSGSWCAASSARPSAFSRASLESLVFLMRSSSSASSSRCRPRPRPAPSGSPSSARSDSTRAGSSPSAA